MSLNPFAPFAKASAYAQGFGVTSRRDSPESFRGWRQGDYAPASAEALACQVVARRVYVAS
jgi:hypothetical protein